MRIIALLVILLIYSVGLSSATVSYNLTENTIYLDNGTNTLASILTDVNNNSAISYSNGTYTLFASINQVYTPWDSDAHLKLNDTTLIIDDSTIFARNDLIIDNMTIKPSNYSNTWSIQNYDAKDFDTDYYSMIINDSDISGGYVQMHGEIPRKPTLIYNNYWHDYTGDGFMLYLGQGAAENAIICNNTFENIHLTSGDYNGVLKLQSPNTEIEKLYIYNSSTVSYGMTYFNAGSGGLLTINNFHFKNITGHGISSKEFAADSIYTNGLIEDVYAYGDNGYAIQEKFSQIYGSKDCTIQNVTINNAYGGIRDGSSSDIKFKIFNMTINNTSNTDLYSSGVSTMYMINFRTLNYNNHYSIGQGEIRNYALADIYAVDENSNPIENAVINIATNITGVTNTSVDMNKNMLTSVMTLANGHTPLPSENESGTLAVMIEFDDDDVIIPSPEFTFTIPKIVELNVLKTVSASSPHRMTRNSNLSIVYPDLTWYRTNPNIYQNTTTIVLPYININNETSRVVGSV